MIKVKQLVWDEFAGQRSCAYPAFPFIYVVQRRRVGCKFTLTIETDEGLGIVEPQVFHELDQAKAAAQADFERRVFECLEGEQ